MIFQREREESQTLVKRSLSSVQFSYLTNEDNVKYTMSLLNIEKEFFKYLLQKKTKKTKTIIIFLVI
jgi:hypothetical protein